MPGAETIAVACVVESSLVLYAEWSRVVTEYVSPLLARLHDAHSSRQFRIAFVCYAPTSTWPSPLLSRAYFAPFGVLLKELSQDAQSYGLGQTGGKGKGGMAALDGLVAALELFDQLKLEPSIQNTISHIVHIAAHNPDTTERPLWNLSPSLDSVNWESLPSELRKRDINYSLICVRPCQRLGDFYSSVAAGSTQSAWFPVKPHHSVRLMGYPAAQKTQSTKRTGEPSSSPETKRARIAKQGSPKLVNSPGLTTAGPATASTSSSQTPHSSPQSTPASTVASTSKQPSTAPTSISASPQKDPVSQPPPETPSMSVASGKRGSTQQQPEVTIAQLQRHWQKLLAVEEDLRKKEQQARALEASGKFEEAKSFRAAQIDSVRLNVEKMKGLLRSSLWNAQQKQKETATSSTPSAKTEETPHAPATQQPEPVTQSPKKTAAVPAVVGTVAESSGSAHTRMSSQPQPPVQGQPPQPPVSIIPPSASPQMKAQMQKLVDQRNRTPRIPSASVPSGESGSGPTTAPSPGAHWRGFLSWKGSDSGTHMRREMQTYVMFAFTPNAPDPNVTQLWPPSMAISPAGSAPPPAVMTAWLKAHSTPVFAVRPAETTDTKTNEDNYRTLFRLLAERNICALAAWAGPDGQVKNRIILLVLGNTLVGSYFANGVPEIPKATTAPAPPGQPMQPMLSTPQTAAHSAKLVELASRLTPEERQVVISLPLPQRMDAIQKFIMARARSQQQASQGGVLPMGASGPSSLQPMGQASAFMPRAAGGFPPGPPGPMPAGPAAMNMVHPQMTMGGLPLGMHRRTPSGGALGNVSPEMLQSFLQRNQDGHNNAGM